MFSSQRYFRFFSFSCKAIFQAEDGTPIAILSIHVEYMSPIVDQTIRCINGENTLLKRVFRIPNPRRAVVAGWLNYADVWGLMSSSCSCLESLSTGLPEQVHQVFVRASDLNIVCEVKPVPINQPCDMLIKVHYPRLSTRKQTEIFFSRQQHIMHQQ